MRHEELVDLGHGNARILDQCIGQRFDNPPIQIHSSRLIDRRAAVERLEVDRFDCAGRRQPAQDLGIPIVGRVNLEAKPRSYREPAFNRLQR